MYANPATAPSRTAVTVPQLHARKRAGEKIVMVTAYDASFAAAVDAAGIDVVLVGDSLGMVIQGESSTLPVTLDHMAYHSAAVARGLHNALLIADLPFMSYATREQAYASSARLIGEGRAAMVKLEGSGWATDVIHALSERDIPVCAHLGLTPQSVHKLGGYRVQGRDEERADRLFEDAPRRQPPRAQRITAALTIPTIGIGAGPHCDGQVLVMYDLLGLTPGKRPRFSKNFLAGHDSVQAALHAYAEAVRSGVFPAPEHSY